MRLLLLAAVLAGCAAEEPGMSPSDHAALERAVAGASAEVNRHWAAVERAATLADVTAETERHATAMAADLAALRSGLRALSACPGAPEPAMADLVDDAETLVAAHTVAVSQASDVPAAQSAADAYAATIGAVLHDLHLRWNQFSC